MISNSSYILIDIWSGLHYSPKGKASQTMFTFNFQPFSASCDMRKPRVTATTKTRKRHTISSLLSHSSGSTLICSTQSVESVATYVAVSTTCCFLYSICLIFFLPFENVLVVHYGKTSTAFWILVSCVWLPALGTTVTSLNSIIRGLWFKFGSNIIHIRVLAGIHRLCSFKDFTSMYVPSRNLSSTTHGNLVLKQRVYAIWSRGFCNYPYLGRGSSVWIWILD